MESEKRKLEINLEKPFIEKLIGQELNALFESKYYLFKDENSPKVCDISHKITLHLNTGNFYCFELSKWVRLTKLKQSEVDYCSEIISEKGFTYESVYNICQFETIEVDLFDNKIGNIITSIGLLKNKEDEKKGFFIEVNNYDILYVLIEINNRSPLGRLYDWKFILQKDSNNYYLERLF